MIKGVFRELIQAAAMRSGAHPREVDRALLVLPQEPVLRAKLVAALAALGMEAGVTGHVVAASLGHESVTTTIQSYAKPEAVAGAQQRRTLTVLAGGVA